MSGKKMSDSGERKRSEHESGKESSLVKLRNGSQNNFLKWREALSNAAQLEYGDCGRLVETGKKFVPEEVTSLEDRKKTEEAKKGSKLEKAEVDAIEAEYVDDRKNRQRIIRELKNKETQLYNYVWSVMSKDSQDAVKMEAEYPDFNKTKNPEALWKAIEATHLLKDKSTDENVRINSARKEYVTIAKGQYESLPDYKTRFDAVLKTHETLCGKKEVEAQVALAFVEGLNSSAYETVQLYVTNRLTAGEVVPSTLEAMYSLVKGWKLSVSSEKMTRNYSAAFVGTKDDSDGESVESAKKPTARKGGRSKGRVRVMRCFRCKSTGHKIAECPLMDREEDEVEGALVGLNLQETDFDSLVDCINTSYVMHTQQMFGPDDYIIDSGSQVSIASEEALKDVRPVEGNVGFKGSTGMPQRVSKCGNLPGKDFTCLAHNGAIVNILSQAELEDKYLVEYIPGVKYIVHFEDGPVEFLRRNKLYVGCLRPKFEPSTNCFAVLCDNHEEDEDYDDEMTEALVQSVCDMTAPTCSSDTVDVINDNPPAVERYVSEEEESFLTCAVHGPLPCLVYQDDENEFYVGANEQLFSKKELDLADKAGVFVRNAGYPPVGEAIRLVRDGNIRDYLGFDVADMK